MSKNATKEEIAKSLEGTWAEDHLFEIEQAYDLYNFIQAQITKCDKQIEIHLTWYHAHLDQPSNDKLPRCKKKIGKKNAIGFDIEKYAFDIWRVNVMAIPDMSSISLLQLSRAVVCLSGKYRFEHLHKRDSFKQRRTLHHNNQPRLTWKERNTHCHCQGSFCQQCNGNHHVYWPKEKTASKGDNNGYFQLHVPHCKTMFPQRHTYHRPLSYTETYQWYTVGNAYCAPLGCHSGRQRCKRGS